VIEISVFCLNLDCRYQAWLLKNSFSAQTTPFPAIRRGAWYAGLPARHERPRASACAGPVKFIAKEGLVLNALTLDKTFDECRALQHLK
jgi:hypothetical protein